MFCGRRSACLRALLPLISILLLLAAVAHTTAQYLPANQAPIQLGQVHLYVRNIDAQKRFWAAMGGEPRHVVNTDIGGMIFPNVIVLLSQQTEPPRLKPSTLRHIAVRVPNLKALGDRLKAEDYRVVARNEARSSRPLEDDRALIDDDDSYVAFVRGPDDILIVLAEDPGMKVQGRLDHVHFAAIEVEAMRAWYVSRFGATPTRRGSLEAANLPNHISLVFSRTTERPEATQGHVIDHIGFQLGEAEKVFAQLVSSGVTVQTKHTKISGRDRSYAYVEDPWGTRIELNGGDPGLVPDKKD